MKKEQKMASPDYALTAGDGQGAPGIGEAVERDDLAVALLALDALYLATDKFVADDVNYKVKWIIARLTAENEELREQARLDGEALAGCRQTIVEQASARDDPDMPLIALDLLEELERDAEAQYACAGLGPDGLRDRRRAHAISLLCAWRRRARLSSRKGAE